MLQTFYSHSSRLIQQKGHTQISCTLAERIKYVVFVIKSTLGVANIHYFGFYVNA